jgi:hypothetical protein
VKRRLFNLAASVSLALFVATVALWVRSYWIGDRVDWWTKGENLASYRTIIDHTISTGRGVIGFDTRRWFDEYEYGYHAPRWKRGRQDPRKLDIDSWDPSSKVFDAILGSYSIEDRKIGWGDYLSSRLIRVPFWPIAVVMSAIPVIWFVRLVRRVMRDHAGLCPSCGYDLRATPERCPECGTVTSGNTSRVSA